MLEARTQTVSMDRDCSAVRLFLRFLYVGGLSAKDFSTFQMIHDVAYLSDFYGVGEECASAFSHQEFFDVLMTLWESFVEENSIEAGMTALKTLGTLSSFPERMIPKMFKSFNMSP